MTSGGDLHRSYGKRNFEAVFGSAVEIRKRGVFETGGLSQGSTIHMMMSCLITLSEYFYMGSMAAIVTVMQAIGSRSCNNIGGTLANCHTLEATM